MQRKLVQSQPRFGIHLRVRNLHRKVHGVAIDESGWRRVAAAGAALVWCPASNEYLFGRTPIVCAAVAGRADARVTVAIGTDSRLTGSLDLLSELRAARSAAPLPPAKLLAMVTSDAASVLRQPRAGRLAVGLPADIVVFPPLAADPAATLLEARRRDVRLVVIAGRPLCGDPGCAAIFQARKVTPRPLRVDGAAKLADSGLVRRIAGCAIAEPGVVAS